MSATRLFCLPLLLVAACVPQGTRAPVPLKPEAGPKASLRVQYTGGLIDRSLSAFFRTEQNAYVVVAHLGGDGVIRVLYPASPGDLGYVRGGKMLQTQTTAAHYDGIPSLFSYSMSPFRSLGALQDSYDGRGHGYVFMIASRSPLRSDNFSDDGGDWMQWTVEDYARSHDPRWAVRDFADAIAGGARYTLKFASSFSTSSFASHASRQWDCALLSSVGFFTYSPWWNSWNSSLMGLRSSPSSYCGSPHSRYASGYYVPSVTMFVGAPSLAPGSPAPRLNRPGRRGLGEAGTTETRQRSALNRVGSSARSGPRGGSEVGGRRTSSPSWPSSSTDARASTASRRDGSERAERPSTDRPTRERESTPRESAPSARTPDAPRSEPRPEPRSSEPRSSEPRSASPRDTRKPDTR